MHACMLVRLQVCLKCAHAPVAFYAHNCPRSLLLPFHTFHSQPHCTPLRSFSPWQCWVYGNSFKNSLVAVVVPSPKLNEWAAANGVANSGDMAQVPCAAIYNDVTHYFTCKKHSSQVPAQSKLRSNRRRNSSDTNASDTNAAA